MKENCKIYKDPAGESNTEEKEAKVGGREGIEEEGKEKESEKEKILNIAVSYDGILISWQQNFSHVL